jgi:hypothetical protein
MRGFLQSSDDYHLQFAGQVQAAGSHAVELRNSLRRHMDVTTK